MITVGIDAHGSTLCLRTWLKAYKKTQIHEWVDDVPPAQIHLQNAEGNAIGDFTISAADRVTGGDDPMLIMTGFGRI